MVLIMNNAFKILLVLSTLSCSLYGQTFFDKYEYSHEILSLINSSGSEISPAIVQGKLFFTSVSDEFLGRDRHKQRTKAFYNVYYTQTDNKGYPQMLRRLVPGLGNTYHEGPVSWCEATGELFVTMSNLSAIDSSQRILIKEHIRLKIVIMKQTDDTWSVVEELPFNHPDFHFAHPAISRTGDTLIFSSDMKGGYGNSDLYMSIRSEGNWSDPINLGREINTPGNEMFPTFGPDGLLLFSSNGHPDNIGNLDIYYTSIDGSPIVNLGERINSEFDDFGMVIHPSHEYGYFASNRPGSGSDDLYRVEFNAIYEIIGGVVENSYSEPVPGVAVSLKECDGKDLQTTHTDENGRFQFEVLKNKCYQAMASKQGFIPDLKPFHLNKNIQLRIVQDIRYRILALDIENDEGIADAEIHCNENRWLANADGMAEIDTDSLKMCNLRIGENGYFDYIIEQDPYRFKPGADITDTIRLYPKEKGKAFLLENIVFFLDKWRLLPESETELSKLVKLMKDNPGLKIELASHTDSRGEAQYNVWLSQKRSDSAADFLIANGIVKERIVSKGYGESRLINRCANGVPCTEEEHLENRRTEFIILEF